MKEDVLYGQSVTISGTADSSAINLWHIGSTAKGESPNAEIVEFLLPPQKSQKSPQTIRSFRVINGQLFIVDAGSPRGPASA